jgi:hypothetical protein
MGFGESRSSNFESNQTACFSGLPEGQFVGFDSFPSAAIPNSKSKFLNSFTDVYIHIYYREFVKLAL